MKHTRLAGALIGDGRRRKLRVATLRFDCVSVGALIQHGIDEIRAGLKVVPTPHDRCDIAGTVGAQHAQVISGYRRIRIGRQRNPKGLPAASR